MNLPLALQISQLALSLVRNQVSPKVQQEVEIASILLQIVQKGAQAYEQHVGQPLDPSLIKPRDQI